MCGQRNAMWRPEQESRRPKLDPAQHLVELLGKQAEELARELVRREMALLPAQVGKEEHSLAMMKNHRGVHGHRSAIGTAQAQFRLRVARHMEASLTRSVSATRSSSLASSSRSRVPCTMARRRPLK